MNSEKSSRKSQFISIVTFGILWLIWILVGIIQFDFLQIFENQTDIVAALAATSQEVRIYFGIWLIGSVTICTFFIISLKKLSMGKQLRPK